MSLQKPTLKEWLAYTKRGLKASDGNEIWTIMTAMRGPDFNSEDYDGSVEDLKTNTTGRIRFVCFGDAPASMDIGAIIKADGNFEEALSRLRNEHYHGHFESHARRAIEKLKDKGIIKKPKTT